MDIKTLQLDSGIKYAFRHISSPVAYCALSVKTGTRDEDPSLNGIAHFTEHMLFKGTTHRSALRINNFLEKLGGELNAYTTKEETVIHATVLKEDLPKAVELLADLAFNSLFPDKELVKEREVILEEISSYKDTPSELIFDDFDEHLFDSHPLAKPILGTPSSIKRICSGDIRNFVNKHYTTDNMSFSIVGDVTFDKGMKLINTFFKAERDKHEKVKKELTTLELGNNRERIKIISKKTHQAHCVIGTGAYTLYQEERLILSLLTNILGGPAVNSRLNMVLREKYGLAYNVDATYTPYEDTGLFTIYFGTDKSNVDRCIDLVYKELSLLMEKELTIYQLRASKKQLLGQLAISVDNAESQCLVMGKSLLVYNMVESIDSIRSRIELITSKQLHDVANEILASEKLYTLIYR
ncbi:MAG: pitrilysin family protein [Bacteroidales bacterium]|jgi:predicted Zn-dependent peptidase